MLAWVHEGQVVYVLDGPGYCRGVVVTAAGESARVLLEGEERPRWFCVRDLDSEVDVAACAARVLGG
jgi:hypothetical protein